MRNRILLSVNQVVADLFSATIGASGRSDKRTFPDWSLPMSKTLTTAALATCLVMLGGCFDSSEKKTTQQNADSAPGSVQMQQKDDQKK